jgi:hypothetical protein
MSIRVACTNCGAEYALKEGVAAKTLRCQCGSPMKVPALPVTSEILADDLSDELSERADIHETNTTLMPGHFGLDQLLQGRIPASIKILIGALIGGVAGFSALLKQDKDQHLEPEMQIPILIGAAVAGGLAASLLLVTDLVRERKMEGRHVPAILRWYFSSGLFSLVLWFVTAIVGAFVFAIVDVATF